MKRFYIRSCNRKKLPQSGKGGRLSINVSLVLPAPRLCPKRLPLLRVITEPLRDDVSKLRRLHHPLLCRDEPLSADPLWQLMSASHSSRTARAESYPLAPRFAASHTRRSLRSCARWPAEKATISSSLMNSEMFRVMHTIKESSTESSHSV